MLGQRIEVACAALSWGVRMPFSTEKPSYEDRNNIEHHHRRCEKHHVWYITRRRDQGGDDEDDHHGEFPTLQKKCRGDNPNSCEYVGYCRHLEDDSHRKHDQSDEIKIVGSPKQKPEIVPEA